MSITIETAPPALTVNDLTKVLTEFLEAAEAGELEDGQEATSYLARHQRVHVWRRGIKVVVSWVADAHWCTLVAMYDWRVLVPVRLAVDTFDAHYEIFVPSGRKAASDGLFSEGWANVSEVFTSTLPVAVLDKFLLEETRI